MPIPSRAKEAGSGTPVDENPWLKIEMEAPLLPPTKIKSFSTRIEFRPGNVALSETWPGFEISRLATARPVAGLMSVSPIDPEPVPPKVLKTPELTASVIRNPLGAVTV